MDETISFNDLLSQVLNFNERQIQSVIEEGIDSIHETIDWTYKDIKKFVEKKENARVATTRVHFGKKAKNLHALAFWAKDMRLRGREVVNEGFTPQVLEEYRKLYELDHEQSESPPETVALPEKLQASTDFPKWDKALTNALRSRRSVDGGPLSYVIRRNDDKVQLSHEGAPDRQSELEINMSHNGTAFDMDNQNAFALIFALVGGTDAESWLSNKTINRRSAKDVMDELRNHYDGDDYRELVLRKSEKTLKDLNYRCNEASFSFETYTTKIKEAFENLAKYDEPLSNRAQVDHLLDHIVIPSTAPIRFQIAVQHVRTFKNTTYDSLNKAASYLKAQIVDIFATGTSPVAKGRTTASVDTNVRVEERDGKEFVAGVDVTDKTRRFTKVEWKKLLDAGYTNTLVAEKREIFRKRKIDAVSTSGNVQAAPATAIPANISLSTQQVASLTAAYQAKEKHPNASSGVPRAGANVSAAQRNTSSNDTVSSAITFDGTTWTIPRNTSAVKITSYRNISSIDSVAVEPSTITTPLPTESDNHADTSCLGANFRILNYTNLTCTVTPFLDDLDAAHQIPIGQGATAWDSPDGLTYILVIGQGLCFGERMKYSLINPNQCRSFGISVCDDPCDPYRALGYFDPVSDTHIPMRMNGTFAALLTRLPTAAEIEEARINNRIIYLTDPNSWNPMQAEFKPATTSIAPFRGDSIIGSSKIEPATDEYHEGNTPSTFESVLHKVSDVFSARTFARKVATTEYSMSPSIRLNGSMASASERHHTITADSLSRKWNIPLSSARATLMGTTQLTIRSARLPLSRRYRTDTMRSDLRRLSTTIYTDTLVADVRSSRGNNFAQFFTDGAKDSPFAVSYPIKSKEEAGNSLKSFATDYGIPFKIHSDNSMEQTSGLFSKVCSKLMINHTTTEPYSPWQNRAERTWSRIKSRMIRRMRRKRIPKALWDYALTYECDIISRTHNEIGSGCGLEKLTGDAIDISEFIDFELYDPVYHWDEQMKVESIGRWLGVAHRVGTALCYWILNEKGNVIARSTVQHIPPEDLASPTVANDLQLYDKRIDDALAKGEGGFVDDEAEMEAFLQSQGLLTGESVKLPNGHIFMMEEPPLGPEPLKEVDELIDGDHEHQEELYDGYIGAEVRVHVSDGNELRGKVMKRKRGEDGLPIGKSNKNPMLSTALYEVKFPDGTTYEYSANTIAESIFSQVDSEGNYFHLLKEIVDHKVDPSKAVSKQFGHHKTKSGHSRPKITTAGWEIQVEWKDGSTQWIPLRELKESNPVQLAEYATANDIADEPAFKWWVPYILKKRNKIVSRVKSRYWEKSHKFGIELPKTVKEALELDIKNGNDYWEQAIKLEMNNVMPAFAKRADLNKDNVQQALVGFRRLKCHMVFDIKLDGNFTRKARFVADGSVARGKVDPIAAYSSVVSRDSVRIAFLLAAVNDLNIEAADVGNAYLNAKSREKFYIIAGAEFGNEEGSIFIVEKALYGLITSGAAWRAHLSEVLQGTVLNFRPTKADPDVYIRPAFNSDGEKYYEMILVYVDDLLVLSHDTKSILDYINSIYRLKKGSRGPPSRYLGGNIKQFAVGSKLLRGMTADDYVSNSIKLVESMLSSDGVPPLKAYGNKAKSRPYPRDYRPETDITPELSDEGASRYLQLIGILRWAVELGRIDIYTEVSMLSQHQCMPRTGHLDAIYRIFWYLKNAKQARIIFDPTPIDVSSVDFGTTNLEKWKEFYIDAKEQIPIDMPIPLGKSVQITCYVDSDHASNQVTRRSHTGIIIYIQNSPIIWFSKRQNTVESSSFGSEFVALRIATEMIESLRYKLRMFGVPVDGPARVLCDNKSVVTNSSIPSSMLNKKHNSICYHRVRECQANGTLIVGWIQTNYNQADLLTKTSIDTGGKWDIVNEIFGWSSDIPIIEVEEEKT